MITVKEIDKVLSQAAPRTLSEEWDNDGVMLCENQNKPLKKVLVMLEVTPDGITAAEKAAMISLLPIIRLSSAPLNG